MDEHGRFLWGNSEENGGEVGTNWRKMAVQHGSTIITLAI